MSRVEQRLIIFAVAFAAVIAGALYSWSKIAPQPVSPDAAAQLLALRLPDLASKQHLLSDWRGKVLVVNFWATWCPPCREEIPGFIRLSEKYREKGVEFVGISIDSADKVRDYAAKESINYTLLIGDGSAMAVAPAFGNRAQGLPFTVILDRAGATHKVKIGLLDEAELDGILAQMI